MIHHFSRHILPRIVKKYLAITEAILKTLLNILTVIVKSILAGFVKKNLVVTVKGNLAGMDKILSHSCRLRLWSGWYRKG